MAQMSESRMLVNEAMFQKKKKLLYPKPLFRIQPFNRATLSNTMNLPLCKQPDSWAKLRSEPKKNRLLPLMPMKLRGLIAPLRLPT